jgi:hypothetical protein
MGASPTPLPDATGACSQDRLASAGLSQKVQTAPKPIVRMRRLSVREAWSATMSAVMRDDQRGQSIVANVLHLEPVLAGEVDKQTVGR